jgi:y4mF family transcriptional regulator
MSLKTAKEIGELVRNIRKGHKVTQKELAAASGTGIRFIRELEKGKPTCELGKAMLVLSMLGICLEVSHPRSNDSGQRGKA